MPSRRDALDDVLAGLLDDGAPPATREGLVAVRLRHHRLARRRLRALSAVAGAAAVAMAGVTVAGAGTPVPASPRPTMAAAPRRQAAAPSRPAAALPRRPSASATSLPASQATGASWHLAFLAHMAGSTLRAYVAGPVAARHAAPVGTAGATTAFSGAGASCQRVERIVVEVSSRLAVGRVVLDAPTSSSQGFTAATVQVVGAAEGSPLEVLVARAPPSAARVTARFAGGRVETVRVHGGLAVVVERRSGPTAEGAALVASGREGKRLATLQVRAGRPWMAGCGGR